MRGFLAILVREVAERRLLLLGALLTGFFPLLVPFVPGIQGTSAELRAGTALGLCFTVAAVLAVTLGASVVAGELAAGRLGFYFARPVAGWAVWAGKLSGAAVLSAGAALLVLLPTLGVDRKIELGMPLGMEDRMGDVWIHPVPLFLGVLAAGCLLLVLLSHLAGSMVRSRSLWLLLDLGAVFAAAASFWSIRQTLLRDRAFDAFTRGLGSYVLLVAVAAAVASAVQVTRGRTDARRSHRLLSLVFWSGVALTTAGFAAYSRWVVDVSPADLEGLEAVLAPPAGSWIGLSGPAVGRGSYFPTFLFDIATGRSLKVDASSIDRYLWQQPVFSSDGARAAWLEAASSGYDLKTLDLTRPGARPAAAAVSFDSLPDRMALSPGGRLLAAIRGSLLTVDDLAARKLLASIPLSTSGEQRLQLRFLDDRHLRLYQATSERLPGGGPVWRLTAFDLEPGDLGHGRLTQAGEIEVAADWILWTIAPDGWRVALRAPRGPIRLADLRTGTVIAALPLHAEGAVTTFLADGRLLLEERTTGGAALRLLDRGGVELRRFDFPGLRMAVGGEMQPGSLAMATSPRGRSAWNAFLLRLDDGRTTPIGQDMIPAVRELSPFDRGAASLGSLGTRLFLQKRGALVLFDPATGHLRTLLRAHGG